MFSISAHSAPSRKELRSFGLILAGGFFVIGIIPAVLRHASPGWLPLGAGILCVGAATLAPSLLRYVYPVWMLLGNILGWINSRIILSLIFYGVVTPVRFMMGIAGNDPMNRKFDPGARTYRVLRKPRDASHMRHPF